MWDRETLPTLPEVHPTHSLFATPYGGISPSSEFAPTDSSTAVTPPAAIVEMHRYMDALPSAGDHAAIVDDMVQAGITPYRVDYSDISGENKAALNVAAMLGSEESLVGLMALSRDDPGNVSRLLPTLFVSASKGGRLALLTLSDWAATGKGFPSPDREASIVFEYLAWLADKDDHEYDFYPTLAGTGWTPTECRAAVFAARSIASGRGWFDNAHAINRIHRGCLIGL